MIRGFSILILISFYAVFVAQEDTLKAFTKNVNIQEATASFSQLSLEKMPIQTLKGKDLGQLLQELTPTFVKTYGMGGIASLSIRGGGANHTQVFWNGIAVNSPTLGQTDLSLMPVEFLESIVVKAGVTASFDGNGGIGGSLGLENSNTFYPNKELQLTKEWGSFGIDNTVLKANFSNEKYYSKTTVLRQLATNDFEYTNYALQGSPMLKRENAATQLRGVQQLLGLRQKHGALVLRFNYVEAEREIPVAIGVSPQNQVQLDKSFKSALEWNFNAKNKREVVHQVRVGYINDYLNFTNKSASISSEFATDVLSLQYHTKWYFENDWVLRTQLIGYQYAANSDGFEGIRQQTRVSGYLDLQKEWKDLTALVSFREQVVDFETANFVPTFGVGWNYFKDHELFLNGGINAHQPTLNDLYWNGSGNEELNAEIAKQAEIGLKENAYQNKFDYSVSYFQGQVDNWIQWIPSIDGVWRPQNVKNVSKKGVNANLKYYIKKQKKYSLLAVGNYQYLDVKSIASHFENDASLGKDLIYSPKHLANVDITFYTKKWTVRYSQNYTSKLFVDATNTTYLPYSIPASLELKYRLLDEEQKSFVEMKLGVQNLYGEVYQTVGNQPLPGRYFTFGFVVNFKK